ncbi:PREDICTED: transcription initiation factor TFIID subunit 2 isoform X2 [Nelumbo nucifera]|uniref:Transcription initiation factor TFIID subunit 2 n=1 Tax=Nelumbo nucifera TaxID=4432 RepID=A0A1U8AHL3_NELNU|nr:PREDICTED: transcription initiation factor TFIID subunit 2 isoform X2 [Nelumbo nucifera]
MAKPRKPKNEDQKAENSGAVVRHQKLCLSIDMENCRIYGYTELKVSVPESGIVGLHADDLNIENILVDGEPAEFELFPHYQAVEDERRWCSVSSASTAADAACATYISSLDREMAPNLLILCSKPVNPTSDQQEQPNGGNNLQTSGELKQNLKLIRIDYWVEKAETGIHFRNNMLHTNNQLRRAHCWFPCMDDNSQRCCYDMEFTVANNLVAVSNGNLLYQVLSKDDPPRKTYVYRLSVPVAAGWISLAVAAFDILPDRHSGILSHMCMPLNLPKLRNTVGFFHSAFSHYEDYLSASFPFGSYKQVFIAPEIAVSSLSLGASMSVFSSQVLFDEKVIDQTIDTRIKLAYALARQWFGVYITAEAPNDEWLLDGLAGFLTDSFIKRFLGNNEARYRRYKANCAVCKADVSGATALSSSASSTFLYGTQCMGLYGKIRSWKSVAILQMLEKQMGPESFRKILQIIIFRAQDMTRSLRTLSTKEFRHLANKVGNLERPFLKEFFPRWVGSCGCPVLRMGLSYNKRKNMIELAVLRGCTATPDSVALVSNGNPDSEAREGDVGWPGMMSIRVHELDGMYDHPILPMAGETWQLLEIQCHSKLAARRIPKPKKGSKPDGSDDNADAAPTMDMRSSAESPLLWLRADPEMEYLAEIHFSQPVQMWINQLEKDKDVVAQAHAIATLEALPQLSFSVVNALNNFLSDSKAFWRVRIEAAFALAHTASEETDWAGLLHLVKFYKSRRFDPNIGLPRPNDFHDFPEYFVLEAIPHAIAMVRAADKKSPREAVEFVLQLLKYNDNNGNPYSDVYWLSALVESVGELEFGTQSISFLSSLLKRIDRLLQFDRLMPSYNGILTISCIRTLTQIALKLSSSIPLDGVFQLIKPFRSSETQWQVRIEASRALLDIEFQSKGIDAALSLFVKYLEEEVSYRGEVGCPCYAIMSDKMWF